MKVLQEKQITWNQRQRLKETKYPLVFKFYFTPKSPIEILSIKIN